MMGLALAVTDAAAAVVPPETTLLDRTTLLLTEIGIALLVGGILLCLVRVARGPHLADRAAAVDSISVQLVGLVLLFTLRGGTLSFFDGALALSLMGFVATVGMGQYLIRLRIREANAQAMASSDRPVAQAREEGVR